MDSKYRIEGKLFTINSLNQNIDLQVKALTIEKDSISNDLKDMKTKYNEIVKSNKDLNERLEEMKTEVKKLSKENKELI